MPVEENPFLGLRGHPAQPRPPRTCCATSWSRSAGPRGGCPISVMFPMVSTLGELLEARQVLAEAAGPTGLPAGLRVGMMVEVPAAALKIETFLPHLDFVSIGTNDLTQYTLAAERGNGAVAALSDALDPGVLAADRPGLPGRAGPRRRRGVRRGRVRRAGHPGARRARRPRAERLAARRAAGQGRRPRARRRALPRRWRRQALTLAGADDVRKLVLGNDVGDQRLTSRRPHGGDRHRNHRPTRRRLRASSANGGHAPPAFWSRTADAGRSQSVLNRKEPRLGTMCRSATSPRGSAAVEGARGLAPTARAVGCAVTNRRPCRCRAATARRRRPPRTSSRARRLLVSISGSTAPLSTTSDQGCEIAAAMATASGRQTRSRA